MTSLSIRQLALCAWARGGDQRQQRGAHRLNTSAAMGTVELTGLEMMATQAAGQYLAMAAHRSRTMPAGAGTAPQLWEAARHPAPVTPSADVRAIGGCSDRGASRA